MSGYPIVLTGLAARRCLIVGGGAVAARKAEALLEAGARPVVISPELSPALEAMVAAGHVEALRRPYRPGDLEGAALVIAATDERALNAAISAEAGRRGVLVNVVDDPELCTFTVPAVVRRGDLVVAVSTGGLSPAMARRVREMLEETIDAAYGELLDLLAGLRPEVLARVPVREQRAAWDQLLDGSLLSLLRQEGRPAAEARARSIVESLASQGTEGTGGTEGAKRPPA